MGIIQQVWYSAYHRVFKNPYFYDIYTSEIFKKFYLFIFREWGKEGEREGEKHPCARQTSTYCFLHTPNQGPGLQPRYVP